MLAYKCDECEILFDAKGFRGSYYLIRDGVGTFYTLEGSLDLCNRCWNKMLKKVFKDMEVKDESLAISNE